MKIEGGGGGGGGDKSIHFWKGLFIGSPKISKSEPYELQEKSFCGKVSLLGVQKFQNQSHMSYKRKAFVAEA